MKQWKSILALVAVIAAASGATSPVAAGSLEEFGSCLAREGAVFYGASWCPHCRAQRETLGDAMSHVRYVECSVGGDREKSAPACTAAKVDGYPTWVFADGTRASGEQSLPGLAAKTGCALPSGGGTADAPAAKSTGDSHPPVGPKIIEVPQE